MHEFQVQLHDGHAERIFILDRNSFNMLRRIRSRYQLTIAYTVYMSGRAGSRYAYFETR